MKIPLLLVTGFLGSGKTTFLRHLASLTRGRQMAFLVNEFADLNIDGRRLRETSFPVFEVSGGSLFCECKVSDFIENLGFLRDFLAQNPDSAKGIVIETSGIADPAVIGKLLAETGMGQWFRIARIIALVAPFRFFQYLAAFPNIEAQISCADLVLLNKIDTACEQALQEIEAELLRINPSAVIKRSRFSAAEGGEPIDIWDWESGHRIGGSLSSCANPFASLVWRLPSGISHAQIEKILRAGSANLLRAKGSVREKGLAYELDLTVDALTWREVEPATIDSDSIVLIVDEKDEAETLAWMSRQFVG